MSSSSLCLHAGARPVSYEELATIAVPSPTATWFPTPHAAILDAVVDTLTIGDVRDELAGPNPTPLERILCERVALCWFDAHEMDRRYIDQTEVSFKVAEYRENRRDR